MISMFVYYDSVGVIRAITPATDNSQDPSFRFCSLPFSAVEHILSGKKTLFEYIVVDGNLVEKNIPANFVRTLNTSLHEVIDISANILIENLINDKILNVKMPESFIIKSAINLHFTKSLEPHILIKTMQILPEDLKDGKVSIRYTENLDDASVFVYNHRNQYGYKRVK